MARITKVSVSAGRTFNHPHESYSNLRPQVHFEAEIQEGEDHLEVAKQLQAQAEGLVEDHKRAMLQSIEELYDMGVKQARIAGLRSTIERAQRDLDEARKSLPAPNGLMVKVDTWEPRPDEESDGNEDKDEPF